jgi:coenzyme F420-reducing hydrogenase alpha subunit
MSEITATQLLDKAKELLTDAKEKLEVASELMDIHRLQGKIEVLNVIIEAPEQISELARIEAEEEAESE